MARLLRHYFKLVASMPLQAATLRQQRWAGSILRKLIATPRGRNLALCRAVIDFRQLLERELIALENVRTLLVMACTANGYQAKVGARQINAIISSMLREKVEASGRP